MEKLIFILTLLVLTACGRIDKEKIQQHTIDFLFGNEDDIPLDEKLSVVAVNKRQFEIRLNTSN